MNLYSASCQHSYYQIELELMNTKLACEHSEKLSCGGKMEMESMKTFFHQVKFYVLVILLQFFSAGSTTVTMSALQKGSSHYVLVVYRMAVAATVVAPLALIIERKSRPKMTLSTFIKILLLGLFDPVLDQNLFLMGMKLTTTTFTSSMCNILPAFSFVMACIVRLEKVDIKKLNFQAKVWGTMITILGAMLMTLIKGKALHLPWTKHVDLENHHLVTASNMHHSFKGPLVLIAACFSWSCSIILQAITLRSFPAKLSLSALICISAMVESSVLALVMEHTNKEAWTIHFDIKLLAVIYGGIYSGSTYFIMGIILKHRGPVFYTSFNPLTTVMVAVLSSLILGEQFHIGSVIGAVVIVLGLYLVLWGKSKDQKASALVEENAAAAKGTENVQTCEC